MHPNFPAQFGPVLSRLGNEPGVECVFVSKSTGGEREGIRSVLYEQRGGATQSTHHCSRTFENAVWNAHGVFEACKATPDLRPDLVVGHSGFGTTLFLQELYDCSIVNHFEYFYRPHGSDMDFRPEFPPRELDFLRSRTRNAMILLDLEACSAGYTPTHWQHGLLPAEFRPKVQVVHDGIDTDFWRRKPGERRIGDERIDDDVRIVTYVARGLEAMRGFDVFVRVANRIAAEMSNVLFVVVGSDQVAYGNDLRHVETKSFREHVLRTERPDLSRFRFLGTVPRETLRLVLSLSDLHVYLTVPFVLSWSVLDALSCECTVLASNTAPVREVIDDGVNGLLTDFGDEEGLAARALHALRDPAAHRELGTAGRETVEARYALDVTFPRLLELFRAALA